MSDRDGGFFLEILNAVEKNVPAEHRETLYEDLLDAFEAFDHDVYADDCYGESDALDKVIDRRYYNEDFFEDEIDSFNNDGDGEE